MFTGIVAAHCEVVSIDRKPGLHTIAVRLPIELCPGIEQGASIAIDGVCLTVTRLEADIALFDVMQETIRVTTLADLEPGMRVNVERSMRGGAEVGGHLVSGHVDGLATIVRLERPENNWTIVFSVPPGWMKYIFPKGFIALNGVSLTVGFVDRAAAQFAVYLIPETLKRTTFGLKGVGDRVNFEVERQTQAIVDTMNMFLERLEEKLLATGGSVPAGLLDEMVPGLVRRG